MSCIIQITGLTKQFRELKAVDDLSFSVNEGDIYGFLGQNGAGKSTTLRMLLSLVKPTGGRIEMLGMDLRQKRLEILRQVGAVIERPDLYKYLTAYENIAVLARMSGIKPGRKRLMEQLEQVGLAERADSRVSTYSQGMKQRLGIAVALVHNPRLLILDEPTNGLDPQGIADMRNLILDLSIHHHKTVLVSSHLLSEVELIANRMLIIDKGRKIVEGTVRELFNPSKMLVELQTLDPVAALAIIQGSAWKSMLKHSQNGKFVFEMDRESIPALTRDLVARDVRITMLHPRHSLEDYFLSLTTPNQHVDTFAN
jgi:ABC-2 type transport system ATP-binding protein